MDDQPLDVDDRSPGEKMIASGRAGLAQLGELVDDQRFDVAALVWMLCAVTFVGCEIYSVLKISGDGFGSSLWDKLSALAQTGGPLVALICVAGIALAVPIRSTASRVALWLAAVIGAWIGLAAGFQIASALHAGDGNTGGFGLSRSNRLVGVLAGLALAGFGLVVAAIAMRLDRPPTDRSRVSPPQQTLR